MKRLFFILVCLLFILPLTFSQFSSPQLIDAGPGQIYRAAYVDIDLDGYLDMVAVGTDNLLWYKNVKGEFTEPNIITETGFIPRDLTIKDIDMDGDQDIIFITNRPRIQIYTNDGSGQFELTSSLDQTNLPGTPRLATYGDMNNDQINDYLIVEGISNYVVQHYELINNELSIKETILEDRDIEQIRLSNLNQDPTPELIILGSSNHELYTVNYQNSTPPYTRNIIATLTEDAKKFYLEDFNQDGFNDILVLEKSNGRLLLFKNEAGSGQFTLIEILDQRSISIVGLTITDVNRDKRPDILFYDANSTDQQLSYLENQGTGNLFSNTIINLSEISLSHLTINRNNSLDIDHVDLDNDGTKDLIISDYTNAYSSRIYTGTNEINRYDPSRFMNMAYGFTNTIEGLDLNGDLLKDLIVNSSNQPNNIQFNTINNNDRSSFSLPFYFGIEQSSSSGLVSSKYTNNDNLDLIIPEGNAINLYTVDRSERRYRYARTLYAFNSLRNIFATDFDNDGDQDILGQRLVDSYYYFCEQPLAGDPLPNPERFDKLFGSIKAIEDFNQDGFMDMIVEFYENDYGIYLLNGSFEPTIFSSATELTDLPADLSESETVVADIDNDGDKDIIYSLIRSQGTNGLYWLEQENGDFRPPTLLVETQQAIHFFQVADFDLDQKNDIIFTDLQQLYLLSYDSTANRFLTPTPLSAPGRLAGRVISVFDYDNDLDLDVFYISNSELYWLENKVDKFESFITIHAYQDLNNNGLYESTEPGLAGIPFVNSFDNSVSYTNIDGYIIIPKITGTEQVASLQDSCWQSSWPNNTYSFSSTDQSGDTIRFGFTPTALNQDTHIKLFCTLPFVRCGNEVQLRFDLENLGCTEEDFEIELITDPRFLLTPLFTNTIQDNNTISWTINTLLAGSINHYNFQGTVPLPQSNEDSLSMVIRIFKKLNNQKTLILEKELSELIRCSYDPNDKRVRPSRPQYDENLTLFDETLQYTIRFQNTGNDTAFLVVIDDYLSPDLDWSTFRPISASHPYTSRLFDSGLVRFTFDDIELPDSTTNEIGSQGYVTFRINAIDSLEENTSIKNKAEIYFDFNPAIITNETENVLVSMFPVLNQNSNVLETVPLQVYPNPFSHQVTFDIPTSWSGNQYQLQLYNVQGILQNHFDVTPGQQFVWSPNNKTSCIYFFRVINTRTGQLAAQGRLLTIR